MIVSYQKLFMAETNNRDELRALKPSEIKELLDKTEWKNENLPPQQGGLITPKCVKCGGDVYTTAGGLRTDVCSVCGETHEEPRLKSAGA
jgi:hypothetical protein